MIFEVKLPRNVEAFEMIFEGRDYYVVAKAEFDALFNQAPAPPAAEPEPPKDPKPVAKPARRAAKPARKQKPVWSLEDQVKRVLASGPKTTYELVELFKGQHSSGSVYQALSSLRQKGSIYTEPDEAGTKKNNLRSSAGIDE